MSEEREKIRSISGNAHLNFTFNENEELIKIDWFTDDPQVIVNGEFMKFEDVPEHIRYQVLGQCELSVDDEIREQIAGAVEHQMFMDKSRMRMHALMKGLHMKVFNKVKDEAKEG